MSGDVVIHPGVDFVPIKGDASRANRHLGELGPHLLIEAVAIHAQIVGGIALANQAGEDHGIAQWDGGSSLLQSQAPSRRS